MGRRPPPGRQWRRCRRQNATTPPGRHRPRRTAADGTRGRPGRLSGGDQDVPLAEDCSHNEVRAPETFTSPREGGGAAGAPVPTTPPLLDDGGRRPAAGPTTVRPSETIAVQPPARAGRDRNGVRAPRDIRVSPPKRGPSPQRDIHYGSRRQEHQKQCVGEPQGVGQRDEQMGFFDK